MKKKIMVSLILATVAASVSQVYASPINVTGSTKTAYERSEKNEYKSKSEAKVYMNTKLDDRTTVEVDLKLKSSNNDTKNSETNAIMLYNVYVETKLNENMALRLGSQPIVIGKGLWMSADTVGGAMLSYKLDKANAFRVFAGRDTQDDLVKTQEIQYLAWDNTFAKGTAGVYFGKQDANKYLGVHGEYEIAPKTKISGEYIKNNYSNTAAYVAELANGNAKKVGEFKYSLSYMDADAGIFSGADYTDYDDQYTKKGFKGVGAAISYKISKAGTLTFEKWWGEKTAANDHGSFICSSLKLSCKF